MLQQLGISQIRLLTNNPNKLGALEEKGEWQPRIKISSNLSKATNPGRKRVVRYFDHNDVPLGDVLYDADETYAEQGVVLGRDAIQPHRGVRLRSAKRAVSLLENVFEDGKRVVLEPAIADVRARYLSQLAVMPEEYKRLRNPEIYRVILSERIGALKDDLLKSPDA